MYFLEIIITIFLIFIFKRLFFYFKKKETLLNKENFRIFPYSVFQVDIICDITNSYGQSYVKNYLHKKSFVCIIPVFRNYNKQYENVDIFNQFVTKFAIFLNLKNAKITLASENDYMQENENIKLLISLICNENNIYICLVNYENDLDYQFSFYLKNKKNFISTVINNLFINTEIETTENQMLTDKTFSLNDVQYLNDILTFFNYVEANKEILYYVYYNMIINIKNFCYLYKLIKNNNSGIFLNVYLSDQNVFFSNLHNSFMSIYHNLIYEKIKKDNKMILVKTAYASSNINQIL